MGEFMDKLTELIYSTQVPQQFHDVDIVGLFSNWYFLLPFICVIGYMLYKQSWKEIVLIVIFLGVWWVSGTEYMQTLSVNGELQLNKVLPVVFGAAILMGIIIYMYFGRSD